MLERHSGDVDSPRILEAFNKPIDTWLDFFCFTTFTDRDGKYQLSALAESGFDPLARTTQFMLTEEAYHMQTGENGVGRIMHRTGRADESEGKDPQAGRRDSARDRAALRQLLGVGLDGPVRR